jgi:hypothetical protein
MLSGQAKNDCFVKLPNETSERSCRYFVLIVGQLRADGYAKGYIIKANGLGSGGFLGSSIDDFGNWAVNAIAPSGATVFRWTSANTSIIKICNKLKNNKADF